MVRLKVDVLADCSIDQPEIDYNDITADIEIRQRPIPVVSALKVPKIPVVRI